MSIVRALFLSSLTPLAGVAVLGFALGYRAFADLGQFVLLWAMFLYPLTMALLAFAYFVCSRLSPVVRWHFTLGGFIVAGALALGWFFQPGAFLFSLAFFAGGGLVGGFTGAAFWHLAGARLAV